MQRATDIARGATISRAQHAARAAARSAPHEIRAINNTPTTHDSRAPMPRAADIARGATMSRAQRAARAVARSAPHELRTTNNTPMPHDTPADARAKRARPVAIFQFAPAEPRATDIERGATISRAQRTARGSALHKLGATNNTPMTHRIPPARSALREGDASGRGRGAQRTAHACALRPRH